VGWSAREVADSLDTTPAGVNSALQRARAAIEQQRREGRLRADRIMPVDEVEQSVVRGYIAAWDSGDLAGLARLLKRDAILTMPPLALRRGGREAITKFFAVVREAVAPNQLHLVPTRANRQPALAAYRFDSASGKLRGWGVLVLTLDGAAIAEIAGFNDPELLPRFGLPAELESPDASYP
jgi:RNA polymerase sigma-70 factor (ECF subfamily)